jgi:hypothetical protein
VSPVLLTSEVPASSPSLSPIVESLPLSGRSKAERWSDASPSSSAVASSSAPSFRDVLLSCGGTTPPLPQAVLGVELPPPKITLKERPRQVLAASGPDASGWQQYESRRARVQRLKELRGPRRPVPEGLRGRCFNCFSPSHRAADCRKGPRCFKCLALGHRAFSCAGRGQVSSPAGPRRLVVWRPKLSATGSGKMVATEATPGGEGSGGTEGHNTRARRHRRRVRKRRRTGDAGHGDGGPSRSDDGDNGAPPQAVLPTLACNPPPPASRPGTGISSIALLEWQGLKTSCAEHSLFL